MHETKDNPCVLVIEDDRMLRQLYAQALLESGFRVAEAHNGLQALEKATELVPDAIVADLGLPGIDGYEVCRRLHRDGLGHVPVVAITGRFLAAADVERALRHGCRLVLIKPFDLDRLAAEIRRLTG
jgi:two-component system, cell cycle response regulator DivK